jgi:hypothetical protein
MTQESIPFRPPILAEKLDEKGNFVLVVALTCGVKSRKSSSSCSSKPVTPENLASELVYRLGYNGDIARQGPDQLAVFQGPSEAPISELIRVERPRGKTANRPRPRGLR